jgi:uncharacterized RDD family membrane protein YckC/cytoskeletal protein CcmA (bactofilin family)
MNSSVLRRLSAAFVLFFATTVVVHAQSAASAVAPSDEAASSASTPGDDSRHTDMDRQDRPRRHHRGEWDDRHGNDLVNIGQDSTLAVGHQANSVVSILGSSTDEGDAVDVVSILGNTRVTGSVQADAVSILGTTYIDGKVDGDAVAVVGNVELGPHAQIGGDVVAVLGSVRRDPAAVVHGGVQSFFGGDFGAFTWLRTWIQHCLLYARPLALVPGIGWAWSLALGLLAFYACLALLFREGLSRCVQTFETQPGRTLLAAIIAMLLSPMLIILLCVTVIGIAAVPFVATAFVCAGLFGRAVMLAWLGGRIMGRPAAGPLKHPAIAVLVGGVVVLALYVVPVVGVLVFQLLGFLGFGAVVYTLMLAARAHQAANDTRGNQASAVFGAASVGSPTDPIAAAAPASAAPPPGVTRPHVSASMPRAGFWVRMAALFLDVLLVGFVMSALHHVFQLQLLVLAVYGAIMWKLRGSTVGGIVFDLQVVRLDGRDVDWETAIVRALGCFLSLAVAGLGFIWIAFDDSNQAWHDKIAGTVVVRVPKGVPLV